MELSDAMRILLIDLADYLYGAERRRFMAQTLERPGLGQRQVQRMFGWARENLRKACHEFRSGVTCLNAFAARGRNAYHVWAGN